MNREKGKRKNDKNETSAERSTLLLRERERENGEPNS